MLAVSRAIVEPRDLLIVDEPSKGLAPAIIQNMIDAFQQLKQSGVTVLLVEQNIHVAQQLGDSVAGWTTAAWCIQAACRRWPKTRLCSNPCWGWRYEISARH
jgi:ABC-type branched-subunit amino acid transport system ATPase component